MDKTLEREIRNYALDNGRKFDGKVNMGSIIGKLLSKHPELKVQLGKLSKEIKSICDDVSKLSSQDQISELEKFAPALLIEVKVKEERKLKPLKNAKQGNVVLRLAPSPSGPNHIGHALVFTLNYLYAKEYDGKLILRIEDTNPDNLYAPAYQMIQDDWEWLTQKGISETFIQSSRLEHYYKYGKELIAKGNAYVCTCNQDSWYELTVKKTACPCRSSPPESNLEMWQKMFTKLEPGEAVVRMKTNIAHKNPALRDFGLFRINHSKHVKVGTKYKVWPLMHMAVSVDDHLMGVTHTIRGKDHMDNAKRHQYIFDALGWLAPTHTFIGKINFIGMQVKTSKTKIEIDRGEYDGWDDPRLPFLAAFKRRGFQPQAFHQFALDIGLGENDKKVPLEDFFKSLDSNNRKVVDPIANRYFFVANPVELEVQDVPIKQVKLRLHPDDEKRGFRTLATSSNIIIPKADHDKIESNELYRLMDFCNFTLTNGAYKFASEQLEAYRKGGKATMQWLPLHDSLFDITIRMPDNSILKGKGEPNLKNVKVNDIVQFERFGFCRVDKKEQNRIEFWFAHK